MRVRALWNGVPVDASRTAAHSWGGTQARVWVRSLGWVRGWLYQRGEAEGLIFVPNRKEV